MPVGDAGMEDLTEGPPPVEALGLEKSAGNDGSAADAKVENALDLLFSEPVFDEVEE